MMALLFVSFRPVSIVDDHFRAVSMAFGSVTCAVRFVHCFFSTQGRVISAGPVVSGFETGFGAGRFVEVFPCLAVISVESSVSRFRTGRVERGYGVAIGRGPVAVMFGTLVPAGKKFRIN